MKENKVCSMDTAPGEVIHMDQNGAVKFPAEYLPEVLERVKRIAAFDEKRQCAIPFPRCICHIYHHGKDPPQGIFGTLRGFFIVRYFLSRP